MSNLGRYLLIATLVVAAPTFAQLTTLVNSVEAAPSQLHLPTSPNGKLSFRPCSENCEAEYISVRLTPDTKYFVQGEAVNFTDFRRGFYNLRHRGDGYALVSYEMDENTVTSVEISF